MKTAVQAIPSKLLDFPAKKRERTTTPPTSVDANDVGSVVGPAPASTAPEPAKLTPKRKRGRPRKQQEQVVHQDGDHAQDQKRFGDLQLYTADNLLRGGKRHRRDVNAPPSVLVSRTTNSDASRFTFNAAAVRLFGGKGNFQAIQFAYSPSENAIVLFPVRVGVPGAYAISNSAGNTVQVTPGAFCTRYLKDRLEPGRYPVKSGAQEIDPPDWAAAPRGFVIPLRARNKILEQSA